MMTLETPSLLPKAQVSGSVKGIETTVVRKSAILIFPPWLRPTQLLLKFIYNRLATLSIVIAVSKIASPAIVTLIVALHFNRFFPTLGAAWGRPPKLKQIKAVS
jgi:hypothetical protein